ncbi:MAG: hypothetical protein HY665_00065 [Chloroflexi bacterium]|nr:hypothetical protein [Chloroflexota bacterium]
MSHDWSQVYLYVGRTTMERFSGKKAMPEDMRVVDITRDQERDLAHLKNWIYETRVKHRRATKRDWEEAGLEAGSRNKKNNASPIDNARHT